MRLSQSILNGFDKLLSYIPLWLKLAIVLFIIGGHVCNAQTESDYLDKLDSVETIMMKKPLYAAGKYHRTAVTLNVITYTCMIVGASNPGARYLLWLSIPLQIFNISYQYKTGTKLKEAAVSSSGVENQNHHP